MKQIADHRRRRLAQLQDTDLDVLVIGGGIVGAGAARDAAMRGLKVLLVEQADFASGTSSRSSRLLHGGIRYLAQGRIRLVREASVEKTILHRIAPHLAEPLAFTFPTRRKSNWARWKLAIGVRIYDWLCGRRNLGKSSVLSRQATLERLPFLAHENLTGAVRYFDGMTNDARLVLDTLSAAEAAGAELANYTKFQDASRQSGYWLARLTDSATGDATTVRARCVVNAAGPWSDRLPNSRTKLRLTKGVHLVIDRAKLPVDDAVVITESDRILFIIPWGERVILGTTDTDYDGPIGSPECEPDDANYIISTLNAAFSEVQLCADDVISSWAGLRPLVAEANGDPSDISRRHKIIMSHPGWWDVTGGKLTTYRLMAEETIDGILSHLGKTGAECRTDSVPLTRFDLASGILPPPVCREVVDYYCDHEWALHLQDIMIRRTSWRYYHQNHDDIAEKVSRWMAESLGWSEVERLAECDEYSSQTSGIPSSIVPKPHADFTTSAISAYQSLGVPKNTAESLENS